MDTINKNALLDYIAQHTAKYQEQTDNHKTETQAWYATGASAALGYIARAINAGDFDIKTPPVDLLQIDRTQPVHVRFKQSINEDDFIEPGMEALLTDVQYYMSEGQAIHFILYFDMTDSMQSNKRLLKEVYYPNVHTAKLPSKPLYTAEEAGMYTNKLVAYYGDLEMMTLEQHQQDILEYLEIVQ